MSAMVLCRQSIENGVQSRIEDAIGGWVAGVTNDLRQHRKSSSRDDASEIGSPELLPFSLVHTALEIAALAPVSAVIATCSRAGTIVAVGQSR